MIAREQGARRRRPNTELLTDHEALDFVWTTWIDLTPAERLRRSWALRKRLRDPQAVHDAKLFPRP